MKKIIFSLIVTGLIASNCYGSTVSATVAAASMTKFITGSSKITSVTVAAPTATNAAVTLVDTFTNLFTYSTPSYTTYLTYATNVPIVYTNYQGIAATNYYLTNVLVDVASTVATNIGSYVTTSMTAPASSSINYVGINLLYNNGVWVTNTGAGNATIVITYIQ